VRRSPTTEGFTLVEVLIALVVFVVGALGMLSMLTGLMWANTYSRNVTEATQLAQDRLEIMRSQGFSALGAGSDTVGSYSRSWTVDTAAVSGAAVVAVTVQWQDKQPRQVRLQTVLR
jgi:type IV pilus assembly protein PilV